jgi:hypothetical protein
MIDLFPGLSPRKDPGGFMHVAMREHGTFDDLVFRCGNVYYCNSIIIVDFVWALVPDCLFENIFCAYFRIEFTQQLFNIVPTVPTD